MNPERNHKIFQKFMCTTHYLLFLLNKRKEAKNMVSNLDLQNTIGTIF